MIKKYISALLTKSKSLFKNNDKKIMEAVKLVGGEGIAIKIIP